DIRGTALHTLKQGWKYFFRIEICGRRDADRSHDSGAQIRENVPEKIGAHNYVKPARMAHEMSGQDIDMILVCPDFRIVSGHRVKAFIPEGHGMNDPV